MKLPFHLADKYPELTSLENDQDLFEKLNYESGFLLNFLIESLLDETWIENHSKFLALSLQTFDRLLLEDRLAQESLEKLSKALFRYSHLTHPYLPQSFVITARGFSFQVSALLLAIASPLFRSSIRQGARRKSFDLDPKDVERAIQFIELGRLDDLETWSQKEILTLLEVAEIWNVTALKKIAEKTLAKFLTEEHLFEVILEAYKKNREVYLFHAIQFFNQRYENVQLQINEQNTLTLVFKSLIEEAVQVFHALNVIIKGLKFTGYLTLDPLFLQIVLQAKHLWMLDVSETEVWSPFFLKLPVNLQYFKASACRWMNDTAISSFKEVLKDLKGLDLSHDTEVGFRGYAELKFFKSLVQLSLENCIQIDDAIFSLIVQATPGLQELNLRGCSHISERGLQALFNYTQLEKLDLSKTNVTEAILLGLGSLQTLILDKVPVTLDVLKNLLKAQPRIENLSIKENRLSEHSFKELVAQFPHVEIEI